MRPEPDPSSVRVRRIAMSLAVSKFAAPGAFPQAGRSDARKLRKLFEHAATGVGSDVL